MPPMYWSTGSQPSTAGRSVGASAIQGSVKRAKYQDESTNVSMESVSRRPGPPQRGQEACFQVGCRSSGLPGASNETSSGSTTGSASRGTATGPQASQCTTGIGQPQ